MSRHCTQCGAIATKQTDSLFVCEVGHENWINPAVGAVVVVIKGENVLYGVRSIDPGIGKLSLPGGFIEVGDTAEETAIREVREEMGVTIELLDYLGTYTSLYAGRPALDLVFIASHAEDEQLRPGDDMDGGMPVWRSINDLPDRTELAWDWYSEAQNDLISWWRGRNR